jgi:hypothetical protein
MTKNTVRKKAGKPSPPILEDRYWTEQEAAHYLQQQPRTLRLWRTTKGLPFRRVSAKAVRYRRADLDDWMGRFRVAVAA